MQRRNYGNNEKKSGRMANPKRGSQSSTDEYVKDEEQNSSYKCSDKNNFRMCSNMEKNFKDQQAQYFVEYSKREESTVKEQSRLVDDIFRTDRFLVGNCHSLLYSSSVEPIFETVLVNKIPIKMEIDTGAGISAISDEVYEQKFLELPLKIIDSPLKAYDKHKIDVVGYLRVDIERQRIHSKQVLYVVRNGGPPIIGRNWLYDLGMWPPNFFKI